MNKYFVRDTPLADLEQMMMAVPNFAPRGSAPAVLCRYQTQAADVDCHNCLQHRRGYRSMMCLYLTERLQAGIDSATATSSSRAELNRAQALDAPVARSAVTMEELIC